MGFFSNLFGRRKPRLPPETILVNGQPVSANRTGSNAIARLRADGALYSTASGFGTARDPQNNVKINPAAAYTEELTKEEIDALVTLDWGCQKLVQTLPKDALRKWIDLKVTGGPPNAAEKILDRLEELNASAEIRQTCIWDRQYGGATLLPFINTGTEIDTPLKRDKQTGKLDPGRTFEIREVKAFSRYKWVNPNESSNIQQDARMPGYGRPEFWTPLLDPLNRLGGDPKVKNDYSASAKIHATRLHVLWGYFPFEPDTQSEWGRSVLESFIDPWKAYMASKALTLGVGQRMNETRMKVGGLRKLIADPESKDALRAYAEEVAAMRSALRMFLIDANDELEDAQLNITGMTDVIEVARGDVAASTGMSERKFFGLAHAGMSDNDETGAETDDALIAEYQKDAVLPQVNFMVELVVAELSLVDPAMETIESWKTVFRPLREETPTKKAERRKTEAETDKTLWETAAIGPSEIQGRLKNDPDQPYKFEVEDADGSYDPNGLEFLTDEEIALEEAKAPPPPPTLTAKELEKLMPEPEVRKYLQVGRKGLTRLIQEGKLQAYLINGRRKFTPSSLHKFMGVAEIIPGVPAEVAAAPAQATTAAPASAAPAMAPAPPTQA